MILSEVVLSMALLGGVRDHLDTLVDDEGFEDAMEKSREQFHIRTKDDLERLYAEYPGAIENFQGMLDVNKDGKIDMYELAVLGLDGASAAHFKMTEFQAVAVADGACREDGELDTAHVDETHFKSWFIETVWRMIVDSGDVDGDGVVSEEEWESLLRGGFESLSKVKADDTKAKKQAEREKQRAERKKQQRAERKNKQQRLAELEEQPRQSSFFEDLWNIPLPSNTADVLILAGSMLTSIALANSFDTMQGSTRRRLGFLGKVGNIFKPSKPKISAPPPIIPAAPVGAVAAGWRPPPSVATFIGREIAYREAQEAATVAAAEVAGFETIAVLGPIGVFVVVGGVISYFCVYKHECG